MADKKTTKKVKELKVREIVTMYNALKSLNLYKLNRETQRSILLVSELLRPVFKTFEENRDEAMKRLRPEGFDKVLEKNEKFNDLSDEEKGVVSRTINTYQTAVNDYITSALDKTEKITYEGIEPIKLDAICEVADANKESNVELLLTVRQATA